MARPVWNHQCAIHFNVGSFHWEPKLSAETRAKLPKLVVTLYTVTHLAYYHNLIKLNHTCLPFDALGGWADWLVFRVEALWLFAARALWVAKFSTFIFQFDYRVSHSWECSKPCQKNRFCYTFADRLQTMFWYTFVIYSILQLKQTV